MQGERVSVIARRMLEAAGHFAAARTDDGLLVIGPGFRIGVGGESTIRITHLLPTRQSALMDARRIYFLKLAAVASYATPFIAKDWGVDLTSPGLDDLERLHPFGPEITVVHPDGV